MTGYWNCDSDGLFLSSLGWVFIPSSIVPFYIFFYFSLPFSVLMIETYVSNSKKKIFPERQKTKVSRGTVARFNWDLTSPFTHWGPLSLFYSAHGFLDSSSDTDWHKHRCTNRKTEKSKESSSPVDTGTLRQLLWMAEKQWSTFRPPVKRRCQAAGAGGCYHLHSASPLTRLSGEGLCFTGTQDLKTLCFPI